MDFEEIENKHKILIEKALEKMKEVDDPKHSFSHILQVVEYTKEILENVEANSEVCIIAAYWHDVGRAKIDKGHALLSAELLKEEMQNLNYNKDFIEQCYKAVCKHSWNEEPETLEGIIIRDADKIDFVGINRWEECIKEGCEFKEIRKLLPVEREELLKLEVSRKIFDREIGNLIMFLHDKIFNK